MTPRGQQAMNFAAVVMAVIISAIVGGVAAMLVSVVPK